MSKVVRLLGSIVFALFMHSVPVLFVLSVTYHWAGFLRFLFALIFTAQLAFVIFAVYDKTADKEEDNG